MKDRNSQIGIRGYKVQIPLFQGFKLQFSQTNRVILDFSYLVKIKGFNFKRGKTEPFMFKYTTTSSAGEYPDLPPEMAHISPLFPGQESMYEVEKGKPNGDRCSLTIKKSILLEASGMSLENLRQFNQSLWLRTFGSSLTIHPRSLSMYLGYLGAIIMEDHVYIMSLKRKEIDNFFYSYNALTNENDNDGRLLSFATKVVWAAMDQTVVRLENKIATIKSRVEPLVQIGQKQYRDMIKDIQNPKIVLDVNTCKRSLVKLVSKSTSVEAMLTNSRVDLGDMAVISEAYADRVKECRCVVERLLCLTEEAEVSIKHSLEIWSAHAARVGILCRNARLFLNLFVVGILCLNLKSGFENKLGCFLLVLGLIFWNLHFGIPRVLYSLLQNKAI